MKVTLYKRPDGRQEIIDVKNILPEDKKWFIENNAIISMEDLGDDFAVYADIGIKDEDGEPVEVLALASGRTCEQTMNAVRLQCISLLEQQ